MKKENNMEKAAHTVTGYFTTAITVNKSAYLVVNGRAMRTSKVERIIQVDSTRIVFETKNSYYSVIFENSRQAS